MTEEPGSLAGGWVDIHYRRLSGREEVFRQELILDGPDVKVTLASPVSIPAPILIGGEVVLESGADAVWFTFPGAWHDIGRFHRSDGSFTGLYANILTPPRMAGARWETTDLFLDIWIAPGGEARLLDEDELERALTEGLIDAALARRARDEAASLLARYEVGSWPPTVVSEWTRERALAGR